MRYNIVVATREKCGQIRTHIHTKILRQKKNLTKRGRGRKEGKDQRGKEKRGDDLGGQRNVGTEEGGTSY